MFGGEEVHPLQGLKFNEVEVNKKIAQHARYGVLAINNDDNEIALPNKVTVDIVTPLILCKLGIPLDKYMDSYKFSTKTM